VIENQRLFSCGQKQSKVIVVDGPNNDLSVEEISGVPPETKSKLVKL